MTSRILMFLLGLVGLAACTGGDETATTTATTETTTTTTMFVEPPNLDLQSSYFEALAAGRADTVAVAAALPGSPAAIYADHQATVRQLTGVATERTMVEGGDDFDVCDADGTCASFDAVVVDPSSGMVTSFSIDGTPLDGRIAGSGRIADRDGVIARVSTSYVSAAGDVFVVIEIDNTTAVPVELFGFAAVLDPAGDAASVEASGAWGSQQLPAGTDGELLVVFPPTEPSGAVLLSGLRGDGLDFQLEVGVPTPG